MENAESQVEQFVVPEVRIIPRAAPLRWLALAWQDMRAAPFSSLFYGGVFALMGWLLNFFVADSAYLVGLVTGFMLLGPFLAIGLYDLSRRRERGEPLDLGLTLMAWEANAPAIGLYSIILALLLAVWIRISVVLIALFFTGGLPNLDHLLAEITSSADGMVFLLAYATAGAGFALLVFASSVVSVPMLLDKHKMDALTAMIVSFNAMRQNFAPMLLWGMLIVALIGIGLATFYLGLIVAMPLVGHATWHAYRETVG